MQLFGYYDTSRDIVAIRAVGPVTKENARKTAQEALELSRQNNCFRLLFDLRECEEGQSIIRGFETMENMEKSIGLSSDYKCAVVYDPEKYSPERAKFIENVATNRPNPAFRMFTNMDQAIHWLKPT